MIYSSIQDNWMRVEIMHSVAQSYYESTHDSDFRERIINRGAPFPFDALQFDTMEKESCIVGMVMAWCVVTLESLVNHSLADIMNNRTAAIVAIEYPGQITNKLRNLPKMSSDLSKKLFILSDSDENNSHILSLADELSDTRNLVVHDKPFNYTDLGDGEVALEHYRARGDSSKKIPRYEDLDDFYEKCEQIKSYIFSIIKSDAVGIDVISFTALKNG
ncbi:MAG: hypothetical protein PHZ02_05625 [Desulfocapsaceae bacterium]|nr:hypothetical protein [Desulfocapsaceae bacterium]